MLILQVPVAGVEAVSRLRVVLGPERHDALHPRVVDVDDGEGVVLLERDEGLAPRHRDELRLQVLRHRGARPEEPDPRLHQGLPASVEAAEVGGAHPRARTAVGDVDDAHGSLGVHRGDTVHLLVGARLALVRHEDAVAVGGEGDHVGEGAHGGGAEEPVVAGGVEGHQPGIGLDLRLHRHREDPTRHVHAVRRAAEGADVDRVDAVRTRGVAEVEHVHRDLERVHHERPARPGVVGHDLGAALGEDAGGAGPERGELEAPLVGRREGGGGEGGREHGGVQLHGQVSCGKGRACALSRARRVARGCDGGVAFVAASP